MDGDNKTIEDLKAATREAREILKGLRLEIKEIKRYREEQLDKFRLEIHKELKGIIADKAAEINESTDKAAKSIKDNLYTKFETLTKIILGEVKGQVSLSEFMEARNTIIAWQNQEERRLRK